MWSNFQSPVNPLLIDVGEDSLEGIDVRVDIRDECGFGHEIIILDWMGRGVS